MQAWDASRVSAAIPSGVGFLGAGLIVKSSDVDPVTGERHHLIQGITTAAGEHGLCFADVLSSLLLCLCAQPICLYFENHCDL